MKRISIVAVVVVVSMLLALAYSVALPATAQAPVLTWTEGSPEGMPRYNGGIAIVGNNLYTIGGLEAPPANGRQVEVYNVGSTMWTLKMQLPDPQGRYGIAAVAIGNTVYAFGGSTTMDLASSSVDMYNAATDTWITGIARYPVPVVGATAVYYGGKIYLFGGASMGGGQANPENYYGQVYEFNPETLTFASKTVMPTPRAYAVGTVVGSQILLSGGVSNPPTTANEIFNPATNSWTVLSPLPMTREGAAGAALPDGKVYLVGGKSTNKVLVYDPSANAWSESTPMLYARDYPFVATYSNKLYVMGGRNPGGVPVQKMEIGAMVIPPTPTPAPTAIATAAPTPTPTPVPPSGSVAVSEALKGIAGKYTIIWGYDPVKQEWKIYDPSAPAIVNDLKLLQKGQGYFMSVTETVTLVYGQGSYPLYKGWNLIGWLG